MAHSPRQSSTDPASVTLTDRQLETLLEVAFVVALADDELGEAEQARLRELFGRLADGRLPPGRLEGLMLDAVIHLEREGLDARLARARGELGDPVARAMAVRIATEIAEADGVSAPERRALETIAEALRD